MSYSTFCYYDISCALAREGVRRGTTEASVSGGVYPAHVGVVKRSV